MFQLIATGFIVIAAFVSALWGVIRIFRPKSSDTDGTCSKCSACHSPKKRANRP